ncbi:MAG: cytochrome c family protein [Candidatus Eisenbacteria sp.]|nr:cytochrome c family protein [Candidatus Eisenbacteria bacterium]
MRRFLFAIVIGLMLLAAAALGQQKTPSAEAKREDAAVPLYVGVKSCRICHKSKRMGNQYGAWLKGPHAGAYATLSSEASVKIAREMGLKTAAEEAPECLSCHSTAHGLRKEEVKGALKLEDGVQCESCHGPGNDYKKLPVMMDHGKAVESGLWEISEKTCLKCHNEQSPTFSGFEFRTAIAGITHAPPIEAPPESTETHAVP